MQPAHESEHPPPTHHLLQLALLLGLRHLLPCRLAHLESQHREAMRQVGQSRRVSKLPAAVLALLAVQRLPQHTRAVPPSAGMQPPQSPAHQSSPPIYPARERPTPPTQMHCLAGPAPLHAASSLPAQPPSTHRAPHNQALQVCAAGALLLLLVLGLSRRRSLVGAARRLGLGRQRRLFVAGRLEGLLPVAGAVFSLFSKRAVGRARECMGACACMWCVCGGGRPPPSRGTNNTVRPPPAWELMQSTTQGLGASRKCWLRGQS